MTRVSQRAGARRRRIARLRRGSSLAPRVAVRSTTAMLTTVLALVMLTACPGPPSPRGRPGKLQRLAFGWPGFADLAAGGNWVPFATATYRGGFPAPDHFTVGPPAVATLAEQSGDHYLVTGAPGVATLTALAADGTTIDSIDLTVDAIAAIRTGASVTSPTALLDTTLAFEATPVNGNGDPLAGWYAVRAHPDAALDELTDLETQGTPTTQIVFAPRVRAMATLTLSAGDARATLAVHAVDASDITDVQLYQNSAADNFVSARLLVGREPVFGHACVWSGTALPSPITSGPGTGEMDLATGPVDEWVNVQPPKGQSTITCTVGSVSKSLTLSR
jgi:hypothetical protein